MDHIINVKIKAKMENGHLYLSGESTVKLTELSIPSPDIAIASVRDEVVIRFQGELIVILR